MTEYGEETNSTFSVSSEGQYSIALERCPLCFLRGKHYHCHHCIKQGHFSHSKPDINCDDDRHISYEKDIRFSDILSKWEVQKKERLKLQQRIAKGTKLFITKDMKTNAIIQRKQQIHDLKCAMKSANDEISKVKQSLRKQHELRSSKHNKQKRYSEKIHRIKKYIIQLHSIKEKSEATLIGYNKDLSQLAHEHIKVLMQYIFPIECIEADSDTPTNSSSASTIDLLAEARQMTYVNGRWVMSENNGDLQYTVIVPDCRLPRNGDYSLYGAYASNGDLSVVESYHGNPAYSIAAALNHIAHLTCVLSYLLDIHLPHRFCYNDFSSSELTEKRFNKLILRLNQNIVHLCCSQNVPIHVLNPRQTVSNLLVLLKLSSITRYSSIQPQGDILRSIEESVQTDSEDEYVGDVRDWPHDWEDVPTNIPLMEASIAPKSSEVSQLTDVGQESTVGLLTSAAGSVVSLWRAATDWS